MTTAFDLLQEMRTYVHVSAALLNVAKSHTDVNDETHADFIKLCTDWADGVYDEDPGYVVSEIEYILGV